MKTKIEATIPTTQYGNIRPVFELEEEDDFDSVVTNLKYLWNRFGETPLKDKQGGGKRIETYTGEVVFFNEDTHTYTDENGKVLLSGSKYAESVSPKFDLAMMLPKTASAWGVLEDQLGDLWKMNADVSTSWGSAIHKALEIYHVHGQMGEVIKSKKELEENYVLPKNKFLRQIVESFVSQFGSTAISEVVVSDVANGMVGTIDRLEEKDGAFRVGDYKTNYDMDDKKILKYQHQLSFYAHILQNKGMKVSGLDLYYLDADFNWVHKELEILPLTK